MDGDRDEKFSHWGTQEALWKTLDDDFHSAKKPRLGLNLSSLVIFKSNLTRISILEFRIVRSIQMWESSVHENIRA